MNSFKKMTLTRYLYIFCLCLCSGAWAAGSLEMKIFNVGQANFTIMKCGNNALVIDCGNRKIGNPRKIEFENEIKQILSDATTNIIISHQHADHCSYLLNLLNIIPDDKLGGIYIGGCHSGKTPRDLNSSEVNDKSKAYFCEVYDGGKITKKDATQTGVLSSGHFSGFLGDDVQIELLLPRASVGEHPHDQNFVLKVTYAGRSILLPGDASKKLIKRIAAHMPGRFNDVTVFFLIHHGSIENGELRLYEYLFGSQPVPILSMVSSDPLGKDKIPGIAIPSLAFRSIYGEDQSSQVASCLTHAFNVHSRTEDRMRTINLNKHLFITCNVPICYNLSILPSWEVLLNDNSGTELFRYPV